MHILVLGGAGMIGRKFAERLARDGGLNGTPVTHLTLADVVAPQAPAGFSGETSLLAVDLSTPGEAERLVGTRPDVIYHLAAIVSGEAEADFEKGYRVNLDGTRTLLEAIRQENAKHGYRPRVVYASSNAVFGAHFPDVIPDDFELMPQTSYGTQKAMGELLLADYRRRGFLDGIGLRLPTICVRPGKPNRAASGFFSGIIREPLAGMEAILPVDDGVRHWMASPRAAVGFLVHAGTLDLSRLGQAPNLTMPGLSVTVGEQIAALKAVAGEKVVSLIRREPDETIQRIVAGWARGFEAKRARVLGFEAEDRFEQIIQAHIEDELERHPAGARG